MRLHFATGPRALVMMTMVATPSPALADEYTCEPYTTELYADQTLDVGEVTVLSDGVNLTVTYTVDDPDWYLTDTHLYVGTRAPKSSAPGRFPYKQSGLADADYTFTVPLAMLGATPTTTLYIAAHSVVETIVGYGDPSMDDFNALLPVDPVSMVVAWPGGTDSYFDTTISGDGVLNGTWDGFCVDTDRVIYPGSTYTAEVVSSYDPYFSTYGLVEYPENIDLVNWILNEGYIGTVAADGGVFTYGDVQLAIWTLIDDAVSTAGLGTWTQAHADEIVAEALAYGDGFVPGCGDEVAVLLVPVDATGAVTAQITIAQVGFLAVGLECPPIYQDETAWGEGTTDFRTGWGSYFTYACER